MEIIVSYNLLNTLDESKIKKKIKFVEYNLVLEDSKFKFLVEDSSHKEFEQKFNVSNICSLDEMQRVFPQISFEQIK